MKKQNEPDLTELAKKHESDLTGKEKRLLERAKLKNMTWGQRIGYIWAYDKLALAVLALIILAVWVGVDIYHNKQQVQLLSVAIADCSIDAGQAVDSLEADLLGYMGSGDSHEMISLDTGVQSGDDYTAVVKRSVVVAAGTTDILICDSDLYKSYEEQEAFISTEELLGDSYSDYEAYLTDGRIDLSKSAKWKSYGMTEYEPVYAGVLVTSENTENAKKFIEYFFAENS